jgi:hypothetical protein
MRRHRNSTELKKSYIKLKQKKIHIIAKYTWYLLENTRIGIYFPYYLVQLPTLWREHLKMMAGLVGWLLTFRI